MEGTWATRRARSIGAATGDRGDALDPVGIARDRHALVPAADVAGKLGAHADHVHEIGEAQIIVPAERRPHMGIDDLGAILRRPQFVAVDEIGTELRGAQELEHGIGLKHVVMSEEAEIVAGRGGDPGVRRARDAAVPPPEDRAHARIARRMVGEDRADMGGSRRIVDADQLPARAPLAEHAVERLAQPLLPHIVDRHDDRQHAIRNRTIQATAQLLQEGPANPLTPVQPAAVDAANRPLPRHATQIRHTGRTAEDRDAPAEAVGRPRPATWSGGSANPPRLRRAPGHVNAPARAFACAVHVTLPRGCLTFGGRAACT